ncbi:hypothetical protein [Streptomyces sp. NPDC088733]|uniref:hypothetical protein n=1 Tax=Streptomyces sp. NPDC088733 TaxID=3365880 RepID=UPI003809DF56
MKPTISTFKLFGHRDIIRDTKRLAPAAVKLVGREVPGRMPRVEIVVTNARGMAELATDAEIALAGYVDQRTRDKHLRQTNRQARDAAGRAIATPGGGVLLLVNAETHRTTEHVALTLVHELTHAMQYSRRGVRERHVRHLRGAFGIEPAGWWANREHSRKTRDEEDEAYAAERLAAQLIRTAA